MARGVLLHEFGVDQTDIEWWMERTPEHSRGSATGFKAHPGTNIIDRTSADLPNHPDIKTLFPDPVEEGVRYYQKTGMFPINQAMIIRHSIVEENPWAALNVYKTMDLANEIADAERIEHIAYYRHTGFLSAEAAGTLGNPLIECGLKANPRKSRRRSNIRQSKISRPGD